MANLVRRKTVRKCVLLPRWVHQKTCKNIHNWTLQSFSQDYGLASQTTHVVCVNFIREWQDLQPNVNSERQIFEKLFH